MTEKDDVRVYSEKNIRIVQSIARRWLSNRAFRNKIIEYVDSVINYPAEEVILKPVTEVYTVTRYLLFIWDPSNDQKRFEKLCKHLVQSLDSNSKELSYIGLAIRKEYAVSWVAQLKAVLVKCCELMENLKPEFQSDMRTILVYLHTLISFTGTKTWHLLNANKLDVVRKGMNIICANIVDHLVQKGLLQTLQSLLTRGLGRPKLYLKNVALSAISRLSLLPLQLAQFSDKILTLYLIHILSVPGLLLHFQRLSPECIQLLVRNNILQKSISLLYVEQNLKIVFNALEGRYALCLMANIVHLCHIERDTILNDIYFPAVTHVLTWLLENCQNYVVTKQSNLTYWHPILGWFAQKLDPSLQEAIPHVKAQLYMLWSPVLLNIFLNQPLLTLIKDLEPVQSNVTVASSTTTNFLKRMTEHRSVKLKNHYVNNTNQQFKLGSNESTKVARLCALYQTTLSTLTQLRLDILTGICYKEEILHNLLLFFGALGPNYGLKSFLDLLGVNTKLNTPEFLMLTLFCDCMTHYITMLDDIEMYQQQKPFTLEDFVALSTFLNNFLYKAITQNLFDLRTLNTNPLFSSMHTLLLVIYRRDCRRNFTPKDHWLIKEIRIASFICDLEKGKKPIQTLLQKMPHVIPQADRVRMFRRYVANEKAVCGLTESACGTGVSGGSHCTVVTVRRQRIVEDGYRQLAMLRPQSLKGLVRVRFVNELGLDEAGVDQDGVFKEFLEETIKKVFDPSFNLFRATSEQRLYPSPTSHLQDHHVQLFEFVGRMLGKAVYEGIVVDVPFASFFLSQLLGQPHQVLYSSIDELPSLDPELYQSLTYIKHSQGDVKDLDLTFSVDEEVMGRIVTHELVPGGKVIPVTNDNKINYIHMMAHFRMHTQIKEQSAAFIRGFRSIINPDWLLLFSAPELQHLISGDNAPLDLKALRRHTQYYGGFHDSHRVIVWLWDILEKDFNDEEKRLFLKFVTSCSKPPLLGFAHLEPPFSIRCVEVGDDEDQGDTIGSVIRGFFTIRKKDPHMRLPTSSTCFNLLKLPNYQKKSTLREKLKYAVTSNTGFELS